MPQFIDYAKWDPKGNSKIPIRSPAKGRNEVHVDEILASREAFAPSYWGLPEQFAMFRDEWSQKDIAALMVAHEWLSKNSTGPWEWGERIADDMRHLIDVHIYIERIPDQVAFAQAFGNLFPGRKYHSGEWEQVARSRGVMPFHDETNAFGAWAKKNEGHEWGFAPKDDRVMWVRFTHPEMEAAFLASDVGQAFTRVNDEDPATYAHASPRGNGNVQARSWLRQNAAVEITSVMRLGRTEPFRCRTRYSGTTEALQRDWGDLLEAYPEGNSFGAPQAPVRGPREIPRDFLAYLKGDRDDYEAPYLPDSLRKPFTLSEEGHAPGMT